MRKKRTFIFLIYVILIALPSYSLTWKEIFDAVSKDKYDFPANAKNKNVTCWKKVYWEEYIEGDSYNSGYVKQFRKELKISCPY